MELRLHPEKIDPPWFQELARRAFERELMRLTADDVPSDIAMETAMWYVFELRNNLTDLYKAGQAGSGI